jgi:low temperature requirement protein LtrA
MRRPCSPDSRESSVSPAELFFDLIFVFAARQLSQHLLDHLTRRGAAETLVMLLAVLTVWGYTSWTAILVSSDRPSTRLMMPAVTLLGLFMNASISRAFSSASGGWTFAIPLVVIHLGRTVWTIVNVGAGHRERFWGSLVWFGATTPLWMAGVWAAPDARLVWWGIASGVDVVGTWIEQPVSLRLPETRHLDFDADHMLERCRLFLLIACGETVAATGVAIARAPVTMMSVVTATAAMFGTAALWSLVFGRTSRLMDDHLAKTRDPIRTSHFAVSGLIVMVAGLIAMAAANELAIHDPTHDASVAMMLMLFGGPILFLVAEGWYLRSVVGVRPRLQDAGVVSLLVIGALMFAAPVYLALVVVAGVLTSLAAFNQSPMSDAFNERGGAA